MLSFQVFPRSTSPMDVCATPNMDAREIWESFASLCNSRVFLAFSRDKPLDLPGHSDADLLLPTFSGFSPTGSHDRPLETSDTEGLETHKKSAVSWRFSLFSRMSLRMSDTNSKVKALPGRYPAEQCNLPADVAWAKFSDRDTHSRLLTRLLDLSRSLWFVCVRPPGGLPRNDVATSRWLKKNFWTPDLYKPIRKYPWLLVFCRITEPSLGLPEVTFRGATDRILPKSLTSYKPSYPTTAFQFSSSISYLSSGIRPLFSGELFKTTSGSSRTSRSPSSGVRPAQRLAQWPVTGAFPA